MVDEWFLWLMLALAGGGIVAYGWLERGPGAKRRADRRRRAKETLRAERARAAELEKVIPRAIVHADDSDK